MKKPNHFYGHSVLHFKLLIVYIIFGFLIIFTSAATLSSMIFDRMKNSAASTLYKDVNLIGSDFLPRYFEGKLSLEDVQLHLKGMRTYTSSAIWFTDIKGRLITASSPLKYPDAPDIIKNFDPAESGNNIYLEGTYHNCFKEKVITVIAPVVQGFSTKGYIIVHKYTNDILKTSYDILKVFYGLLFIIYLFSFIFFITFEFFIYRPLKDITYAATQFASGNLDHVITITSNDEIGKLSASLNYMASHLKNIEDYQKKFIANVSHDFRSPLTSIRGYVGAIEDGTIPPEMQDKYLKIILFETERLTNLTNDLLTLNEFDAKEPILYKENFDLHETIKNTVSTFEGRCTNKKIHIDLVFETRCLKVNADKNKIQQVLHNLIDNAIKFSDCNSNITIETSEKGDKIFTSISDYGEGIPKESLDKVFERFYKLDASRGRDKKGTGLGLAIVKDIIQAHNENINVISTEGVGTTFTFTLPKAV